jgi:hypothetical protein
MPPSISLRSAPNLFLMLRRQIDALLAKVEALYGFHREPSKNVIEFRSGDIASFWLLHTASSACATLTHLFRNPDTSPERLFQELLRLAGGLMTFSKGYSLNDLPSYDHVQPGPCFFRIDQILRDLLDTVISTRYFAITLTQPKPAFTPAIWIPTRSTAKPPSTCRSPQPIHSPRSSSRFPAYQARCAGRCRKTGVVSHVRRSPDTRPTSARCHSGTAGGLLFRP